jgi:GNAT superfamily N-acetyltransferase
MLEILRTNSSSEHFVALVKKLDAYLTITDGDEHAFYDQFNKLDSINHVVVYYKNGIPVACGAIKQMGLTNVWEVKRMFVEENMRGKGVASLVINELEKWAKELNVEKLVLETGKRQTEAVAFYHKNNYQITENFGQYIGVENSICFEKLLQ